MAEYLQQGADGKFYYRMVDTVLSRDKNWVRWKIENCPPIERPPVTADDYANACEAATKEFADRKLTSSSDLNFLAEEANMDNLERLKDRKRYGHIIVCLTCVHADLPSDLKLLHRKIL